jgi:hypothetical protein
VFCVHITATKICINSFIFGFIKRVQCNVNGYQCFYHIAVVFVPKVESIMPRCIQIMYQEYIILFKIANIHEEMKVIGESFTCKLYIGTA